MNCKTASDGTPRQATQQGTTFVYTGGRTMTLPDGALARTLARFPVPDLILIARPKTTR